MLAAQSPSCCNLDLIFLRGQCGASCSTARAKSVIWVGVRAIAASASPTLLRSWLSPRRRDLPRRHGCRELWIRKSRPGQSSRRRDPQCDKRGWPWLLVLFARANAPQDAEARLVRAFRRRQRCSIQSAQANLATAQLHRSARPLQALHAITLKVSKRGVFSCQPSGGLHPLVG